MKNVLIVICLLSAIFFHCENGSMAGGGASETVAIVETSLEGIRVSLETRKNNSFSVSVFEETYSYFDSSGFHVYSIISRAAPEVLIEHPPVAVYSIFVIDSLNGEGAFFKITVGDGSVREEKELIENGALRGAVKLQMRDGTRMPAVNYFVYICGTPFVAPTSSDGTYLFTGLPEGMYVLKVQDPTGMEIRSTTEAVTSSGVTVYAEDITITGTN